MTLNNKNKITAIVPAFNEVNTITRVVNNLKQCVQEIIVIDDGSSDETGLRAFKSGAFVIYHKKNLGYDKTIGDGFKEAIKRGADIIITLDADGQHRTEDVNRLTKLIISGKADLVIAQRPYFTHFCERIFALYTKLFYGIKDPLCGLKVYHKKIYKSIGYFDTINSIGTQLMIEALHRGFKAQFIPIKIRSRHDQSRFYYRRLKANYRILIAMIKVIIKIPPYKSLKKNNKLNIQI